MEEVREKKVKEVLVGILEGNPHRATCEDVESLYFEGAILPDMSLGEGVDAIAKKERRLADLRALLGRGGTPL